MLQAASWLLRPLIRGAVACAAREAAAAPVPVSRVASWRLLLPMRLHQHAHRAAPTASATSRCESTPARDRSTSGIFIPTHGKRVEKVQ
ncbi:hypothetical protein U9M48_000910 [Paspalum notatum var. saurae]|uniref:Uncharacterized protein n=1 Tax=Paspalum notatum var. saurae TaxID=547442 RepID=A0AAQ3SCM3_PASNO